MPEKKAKWLTDNRDMMQDMGSLKAMKEAAMSPVGREARSLS
ncbi:MAG: hypothetical protein QGF00_35865 [Planctomycetota bacterium]|jgi:hypothetical protein|nr:hypothetical protein [Planctomycetota bacterium]